MSRKPLRRALKLAYPVHPVRGVLSSKHPAALPYAGLAVLDRHRMRLLVRLLACFALPLIVAPFAFSSGSMGWCIFYFGSLAAAAWIADRQGKNASRRLEARMRESDRQAIGDVPEGSHYVGIAYADGFWTLEEDSSWDRGWLAASPSGLVFEGRASSFALPSHAIHRVYLAQSSPESSARLRIFIDWAAPDGKRNTFSIDGRVFGNTKAEKWSATQALFQEIQNAFIEPSHHPLAVRWPPAVDSARLAGDAVKLARRDWGSVLVQSLAASAVTGAALYGTLRWSTAISPEDCLRHAIEFFGMTLFVYPLYLAHRQYRQRLLIAPPPPLPLPDRREGG